MSTHANLRKEGVAGHNKKLEKYTRHYGDADPSMHEAAPVNRQKSGSRPEDAVGYGADSDAPTAKARADRSSRRKPQANSVATYRKGGRVACKADGGDVSAIEQANRNQAATQNRARGGRTNKKGATHVNIMIHSGSPGQGAPQGAPLGANPALPPAPPPAPPPGLAAAGGPPPMMPGRPMPGALPPPGGVPPMPLRARGGKVHPDAKEDRAMIKSMVKSDALKRAAGGRLPSQKHHMTAGSVTGEGRLEKIGKKPHNAGRPQAV